MVAGSFEVKSKYCIVSSRFSLQVKEWAWKNGMKIQNSLFNLWLF